MAKRMTIGLYIAQSDLDILAWCNMMRDAGLPISKWVAALLMAEKLNEQLDIGAITSPVNAKNSRIENASNQPKTAVIKDNQPKSNKSLLFGSGNTQAVSPVPVPKKKQWAYGWQVKAEDGSYTVGSVINISIARQELQAILNDLRENGHLLAPHIKALIRQSLKIEEALRAPTVSSVSHIFSKFILSVASTPVPRKAKHIITPAPAITPVTPQAPPPVHPEPPKPQQLPPRKKNPLLCNI